MASCLVRRSFLTRGVRFPSQASNWRVALTTFIVRHDRGRKLGKSNESAQTRCLRCNTLHTGDGAAKLVVLTFVRLVTALLLDQCQASRSSLCKWQSKQ